jgi:microcystin-dependent protein
VPPTATTTAQAERVDEHTLRVLANPIIGEARVWSGASIPPMWMACNGAVLAIADYPQLFRILGKSKGGDGKKTFALPNCPHLPQIIAVNGTYPKTRAVVAALSKLRQG